MNSLDNALDERRIELEEFESGKAILIEEEREIDTRYKAVRAQISEMESAQSKLRKEREEELTSMRRRKL